MWVIKLGLASDSEEEDDAISNENDLYYLFRKRNGAKTGHGVW